VGGLPSRQVCLSAGRECGDARNSAAKLLSQLTHIKTATRGASSSRATSQRTGGCARATWTPRRPMRSSDGSRRCGAMSSSRASRRRVCCRRPRAPRTRMQGGAPAAFIAPVRIFKGAELRIESTTAYA
jgi:hypothetical protein